MTNKRAKQILTSYGGQPEKWPADERLLLQQLIFSNTELMQKQLARLETKILASKDIRRFI